MGRHLCGNQYIWGCGAYSAAALGGARESIDIECGCVFVAAVVREMTRASVGLHVGFEVGESVGADDGELVGGSVGDDVGDSVGAAVGDSVGDSVGAAVGDSLGAVVGARVINGNGHDMG